MKPYEKLASFYDKGEWGNHGATFIQFIDAACANHGFKPSSVLDIACGTGSLIGELARRNLRVAGSDISPEMIRVSKEKYPGIPFHIADMIKLRLNQTFDLIVCSFDSFNYLKTDDDVEAAMAAVSRHLNKGGLFIFDVVNENLYLEKHHGVIERNIEGVAFRQVLNYDPNTKVASTVFVFSATEREEHLQKAYAKKEISEKLVGLGFRVLNMAKNARLEEADDKTARVIFVTQKR